MVQQRLGNNTSDTPNNHALHVGSKLMPRDKTKAYPKTAKNIGLGNTHDLCQDIVAQAKSDEVIPMNERMRDEMIAIKDMDSFQYKRELERILKENLISSLETLQSELPNLPARHLPVAIKILHESLMKVQGEATQRIEVVKKNWDHVEMKDFLENLPDATVEEDE